MTNNPLVLAAFSSVVFGAWPLIARLSGAGSAWTAIVVAIGTLGVVLLGANSDTPDLKGWGVLLLAGVVNGLGFLAYSKILERKELELSQYLAMVPVGMVVVTVVGAMLFFGEPATAKKVAGVLLAVIALVLMA